MSEEKKYRSVRVTAGKRGWGGPLVITPKPGKDLIYCVTGGGIHPVAQRIADLTGGTVFDGFKSKRGFEEIAVAVIDCGGTARVGVYPMKGVFTIDVYATTPSGPLFRFIKEDIFVSGIGVEQIELIDDADVPATSVIEEVDDKIVEEVEAVSDEIAEAVAKKPERKKRTGFWKTLLGE
jgi:sorbitol-specific phosphotransferase system component IIBC